MICPAFRTCLYDWTCRISLCLCKNECVIYIFPYNFSLYTIISHTIYIWYGNIYISIYVHIYIWYGNNHKLFYILTYFSKHNAVYCQVFLLYPSNAFSFSFSFPFIHSSFVSSVILFLFAFEIIYLWFTWRKSLLFHQMWSLTTKK